MIGSSKCLRQWFRCTLVSIRSLVLELERNLSSGSRNQRLDSQRTERNMQICENGRKGDRGKPMLSIDRFRLSEHLRNVVSACLVFSSLRLFFSGFSAEHPSSLSLQPLRHRRTNFNNVEAVAVLLTSKFLSSNELTN